MFTIPRLAIVSGLIIFPDGPLNLEKDSRNLSELFRPFKVKIFLILANKLLCHLVINNKFNTVIYYI